MKETDAKNIIKEYWNQYAGSFDEVHQKEDKEQWKKYFRNLLGAADQQSVLDIGTGTGFLAIMAAELGFETVGIDFAVEMLKEAERKAKEKKLDIRFLEADLNQLPFPDESFDYIVNSRVLWTLTDPDSALQEWKRVLRPGGQILSFVRLNEQMQIYTSEEIYGKDVFEHLKFAKSSEEELKKICRRCGLGKVDLVRLPNIVCDPGIYGDWYVLRATKEEYRQEKAIAAISDFWNRRSNTYEEEHELTSLENWKNYMSQFIGKDRSIQIVDLATGTGMIANLLGEMGYQNVTGMDISEGMMEIARIHAKEKNTGVSFVYGNALELPLEDNSIDVLINCRLLWTLLEPEQAICEWKRVVRPGGRIISLHMMEDALGAEEKKNRGDIFCMEKMRIRI